RTDNHCAGAFRGEVADANQPFGFENAHDFEQMFVAGGEKFLAFTRRKFVRGAISPALLDKCERTIIQHDVIAEKVLCGPEAFRKQFPQTFAADLAAMTIEPENRTFWILFARFIDLRENPEPIAHRRDLSERNSRLCHAE